MGEWEPMGKGWEVGGAKGRVGGWVEKGVDLMGRITIDHRVRINVALSKRNQNGAGTAPSNHGRLSFSLSLSLSLGSFIRFLFSFLLFF